MAPQIKPPLAPHNVPVARPSILAQLDIAIYSVLAGKVHPKSVNGDHRRSIKVGRKFLYRDAPTLTAVNSDPWAKLMLGFSPKSISMRDIMQRMDRNFFPSQSRRLPTARNRASKTASTPKLRRRRNLQSSKRTVWNLDGGCSRYWRATSKAGSCFNSQEA